MDHPLQANKRKVKRRIRVQGFLIFCASVAALLLSRFIFPHWKGELWDELLDVLGIFLVMFGFILRIGARGHKKDCSRAGQVLITDGPYGLIRHPMYVGSFTIGAKKSAS
jgi:protein-S-isoprenylcysteine O-methyltransferase Ste14